MRDDGQLSCRKREMKPMNASTALDGHTTVIKMAERGGVPLRNKFKGKLVKCATEVALLYRVSIKVVHKSAVSGKFNRSCKIECSFLRRGLSP